MTAQRSWGLLYSTPMVEAMLMEPPMKSQTRRLDERLLGVRRGDTIWVKETWQPGPGNGYAATLYKAHAPSEQVLLPEEWHMGRWRSSMFMPKVRSRIELRATEHARSERLRDITEADVRAEGTCIRHGFDERHVALPCRHRGPHALACGIGTPRACFRSAFVGLRHARVWAANPKVVALTFERVKP